MEKEQRAQRQLERSAEERERRLEGQRQRGDLRRVAVEEKRRQQEEQDKVRNPQQAPYTLKFKFMFIGRLFQGMHTGMIMVRLWFGVAL